MNKSFLLIQKLSKSFRDGNEKITVLKNINFSFEDNKIISLTGPSGSGKSTLLHLLALLDNPDSGKIIFNNKDLVKSEDEEKTDLRKNDIAIVYQNNNLISDLSAIENIALANLNKNKDKKKSYLLAEKLLKEFGLENRMNHYPYQMSGGEQQRVAIARAIINDPKLLFADEPTGNLDRKNTDIILNYLFKLKKNNRLIIIATHNRDLAKKTDLRLTLSNGNVINKS
jgi:ABC-type lipoprotein export system ATPase subunit